MSLLLSKHKLKGMNVHLHMEACPLVVRRVIRAPCARTPVSNIVSRHGLVAASGLASIISRVACKAVPSASPSPPKYTMPGQDLDQVSTTDLLKPTSEAYIPPNPNVTASQEFTPQTSALAWAFIPV